MTTLDPRALTTCPFCDGKATVMESSHPSGGWYAQCTECNADGPSRDEYGQAAVAWNSRALSQPALAVKGLDDETVKAARIGWEIGRNSWCPAGILADTERTERDWLKALEQIRPALTGSLVASPPPSGEVRWSYDEVERIILDTEPSEMSDRGDRIWTRRMAVALADKLNAVLSSAPATADGWRLVPDGDPVPLDDCPEGLFLFDGHLGFMTEYAVNRQDGFRQRDAFCVDSGEYFWGGTMQARERAKLVVQPMIAAAPTATGGR